MFMTFLASGDNFLYENPMLFELKHLNKTFNEIISRAPYQNYYEADSDS